MPRAAARGPDDRETRTARGVRVPDVTTAVAPDLRRLQRLVRLSRAGGVVAAGWGMPTCLPDRRNPRHPGGTHQPHHCLNPPAGWVIGVVAAGLTTRTNTRDDQPQCP